MVSSSSAAPPVITHLYPAGAQRGTTTEVTATGTFDAATKVWASGKGVTVEPTKTSGKWAVTVAKDAVPGTYWLRAYNPDGASTLRPFIVGMLPEVTEKEPNDEFKKPHVLDGTSFTVNGKLDKNGDVDCFAVQLKKGQTLVASLEANGTLRSPMDGMLQILSADGFVLEENNDLHGLDPQIAFTAKKDGTYVARVYSFPSTPDGSVRYFGSEACIYRLTLTTGEFVDYILPLASHEGTTRLEVRGWNLATDPGRLIFTIRQHDHQFMNAFFLGAPNTARVRREPHPVHTKPKGTLKPPFSAGGLIESPRSDTQFAIEAKKGQPLTIQVESRTLGLAVNPIVRVLDKDGMQVARAEPNKLNGDSSLAFNPTADGTYTIAVSDLYAGGGPRHAFLLRVLSEPDYELSVAADRFAIAPDKPTTIPVKVTRVRGFNKPVEITAIGLPEGVKLEVTQPAKPDPNTITLSFTTDKPVNGSFRLVGQVKDEPKFTRIVRAPLPEFEESITDLWLASALSEAPPKKKK